MANRVFQTDLSVKGLRQLKKDISVYRRQTLPSLLREYIDRLADDGIKVAKYHAKGSEFSPYVAFYRENVDNKYGYKVSAVLVGANMIPCIKRWFRDDELIEQEVNALMMLEYGSGSHADPSSYRGTFPRSDGEKSKGFDNVWFYATEKIYDANKKRYVYVWNMASGERAMKPMREARDLLIRDAEKVAHRVFGWS